MKTTKCITVGDLKDQLGTPSPRPVLYCRYCGAEYSAHAGDYWNLPAGRVFRCCGRPMVRVIKSTVITPA